MTALPVRSSRRFAVKSLAVLGAAYGTPLLAQPRQANFYVYAASSLQDVIPALIQSYEKAYPDVKVQVVSASSDNLVTQAMGGKPADVFLLADDLSMSRAITAGLVNGSETRVFATNSLVLLTSKPTDGLDGLRDPAVFKRLMIANPQSSPAGRYAREALAFANVWKAVQGRVVFAPDSRRVMEFVNAGEVDAAVVYRSDLMALKDSPQPGKGKWQATLLSGATSIRFVVAPAVRSRHLEHANRFAELVRSVPARALLSQKQFNPL